MAKQIKIGIPKAFLYYRYSILWKKFFELLGIKVIISPETNKEIIERGKELSIDEACLSSKIYFGHVSYLVDKCDYLLVPRVSDYGKGNKVCVNHQERISWAAAERSDHIGILCVGHDNQTDQHDRDPGQQ